MILVGDKSLTETYAFIRCDPEDDSEKEWIAELNKGAEAIMVGGKPIIKGKFLHGLNDFINH